MKKNFLFALPKKGRLHEHAFNYCKKSGLDAFIKPHTDIAPCKNLPISLVFLPAKDIPSYISDGSVDAGITGLDVIEETQQELDILLKMNFGKCRLCVIIPEGKSWTREQLHNKKIVTSFPFLTKKYFKKHLPSVIPQLKIVSGSTEISYSLGVSDVIVDLVQTGNTIQAMSLKVLDTIIESEAVLAANLQPHNKHMVNILYNRFLGVVTAANYTIIEYNIPRDNVNKASCLTPGSKAPTITPIEKTGWVAIKALIKKENVNQLIDELETIGATDILVYQLTNCRVK